MNSRIQNRDALATTPLRTDALALIDAAYAAIDTDAVVRRILSVEDGVLTVDGRRYDLKSFERVRLFGFGKATCAAIAAVEALLRTHVTDGVAIDVRAGTCDVVSMRTGTHPQPSVQNVVATEEIVRMAEDSSERDLAIVVVSGGGSSLLCWPQDECDQGIRLYADAARLGVTIEDINTVRKHLSAVKGGGLAALFHPATVLGLVFCDVPGDHFADVASGPTYYDESTIADAESVIRKYGLTGYVLHETPKDRALFERVHNVGMLSNTAALSAMRTVAEARGYRVVDAGNSRYDTPRELVESMLGELADGTVVLAGGEVRLEVTKSGGKGGRCQYVGLEALTRIGPDDLFVPFASDGIDNCEAAGVLADKAVFESALAQGFSIEERLASFDSYDFFEKTDSLIMTGVTDANVSDLYFVLRKKA